MPKKKKKKLKKNMLNIKALESKGPFSFLIHDAGEYVGAACRICNLMQNM